jgi:hypothetical protein
MADIDPHKGYHRDHPIANTRQDNTTPCKNYLDCPPGFPPPPPHMGTYTATPSPHETDLTSHSLDNASQRARLQPIRDPPSRLEGGQPFSCLTTSRSQSRKHRNAPALHKHLTNLATVEASPQDRDLPYITKLEDWAHLLQNHIHSEFASLANKYTNITCPPCQDSSSVALIIQDLVQHFTYRNYQGTMEIQDCLSGIFRLLRVDPSVSLLQQQETNQMMCLGEALHRWKQPRHIEPRDSYANPSTILTCCGPWHNGADHFVPLYKCQDY